VGGGLVYVLVVIRGIGLDRGSAGLRVRRWVVDLVHGFLVETLFPAGLLGLVGDGSLVSEACEQ
jgi:hypothetical protein